MTSTTILVGVSIGIDSAVCGTTIDVDSEEVSVAEVGWFLHAAKITNAKSNPWIARKDGPRNPFIAFLRDSRGVVGC